MSVLLQALMGHQVEVEYVRPPSGPYGSSRGEEADPGPAYFGAVWAWMGSGDGGFGWNLLGGSNLLSESALSHRQ